MPEATDKNYRWTRGPVRHKQTWWWNDDVSNGVSEKRKLWEEWKQGNTNKEKYLEVQQKAKRIVYQAKCKKERKRFGNVVQQDDQKCDGIETICLSWSQADTVSSMPRVIDKDMVRESTDEGRKDCRTVRCSVRNVKGGWRSRSRS